MTPDIHAFYASLAIPLPARAPLNATVRCFAAPEAHRHGDRTPSCSVNLATGAWNCHGCGAHGGAYDAALAQGHTPRTAMQLLITHGLAEPRPRTPQSLTPRRAQPTRPTRPQSVPHRPRLHVTDDDVLAWAQQLDSDSALIRRLLLHRAWAPSTLRQLHIGYDGQRITIPIHTRHERLRGLLRYDPFGQHKPKTRAQYGTRLGLIPHPATEPSHHIILVEGPGDMLAARSSGLPAIAIPSTTAWQPHWAPLLAERRITIVLDCDPPGRQAATTIATSLTHAAEHVEVVDLWPSRTDGYDLTDRILDKRCARINPRAPRTIDSLLRPEISPYVVDTQVLARQHQEASR